MQRIVLDEDEEYIVQGVSWNDLEKQNLVVPVRVSRAGIVIRRNSKHWVGSFSINDTVLVVPPHFNPSLFVDLYLYANGASVLSWNKDSVASMGSYFGRDEDAFLILMASVFVDQVKTVIGHNLAKKYVEKIERRQGIKGRPLWVKDFGRHPSEGITCRFYELSHQNKLNEAIMAGLEAASIILNGSPHFSSCQELIFQWRGILGPLHTPSQFVVAEAIMEVTRITEHYRTPLLIAKAIVERRRTDIFGGAISRLPSLEFYLPQLFEKFAYRLISEFLAGSRLRAKEQAQDSKALLDGRGEKYRSIIPDIVINSPSAIEAIVDAKFKPRYVTGVPGKNVPKKNRVTNADIYQLFFYQTRAARLNPELRPPATAIVAPLFGADQITSDPDRREVVWADDVEKKGDLKISVLPIPMDSVFEAISNRETAKGALTRAPELKSYLDRLVSDVANRTEVEGVQIELAAGG